jgi:hypothetical protein
MQRCFPFLQKKETENAAAFSKLDEYGEQQPTEDLKLSAGQ